MSIRSGGSGGSRGATRRQDPLQRDGEPDAWQRGYQQFRAEQVRRREDRFQGNAWTRYDTPVGGARPMQYPPRSRQQAGDSDDNRSGRYFQEVRQLSNNPEANARAFFTDDDDRSDRYFRDQMPERPPLRNPRSGGAVPERYRMDTDMSDDEPRPPSRAASVPSWARDDRSVDTEQRAERERLRKKVFG